MEKLCNHRFVIVEKINPITGYAINVLQKAGWNDVLYMDKYVALLFKKESYQIVLAGFTTKKNNKSILGCSALCDVKETDEIINIILFLNINYKEESTSVKIPDFISLNTNALFQYSKIIFLFKERIKNYDKGIITHNNLNKFIKKYKIKINYQITNFKNNLIREKEKHYVC